MIACLKQYAEKINIGYVHLEHMFNITIHFYSIVELMRLRPRWMTGNIRRTSHLVNSGKFCCQQRVSLLYQVITYFHESLCGHFGRGSAVMSVKCYSGGPKIDVMSSVFEI